MVDINFMNSIDGHDDHDDEGARTDERRPPVKNDGYCIELFVGCRRWSTDGDRKLRKLSFTSRHRRYPIRLLGVVTTEVELEQHLLSTDYHFLRHKLLDRPRFPRDPAISLKLCFSKRETVATRIMATLPCLELVGKLEELRFSSSSSPFLIGIEKNQR